LSRNCWWPLSLPMNESEPVKTIIHRGLVEKLSYQEHAWKPRILEVTSDFELRYCGEGEEGQPRGIISLEDCSVSPCKYIGSDGRVVPHVMLCSAERSTSIRQGRWWIKRDYYFACQTAAELKQWKSVILKVKHNASEASFEPVQLSASMIALEPPCEPAEDEDDDSPIGRARAGTAQRLANQLTSFVSRFTRSADTGEIYMLGCAYDASALTAPSIMGDSRRKSMPAFARDVYSRLWFTYRRDFRSITPTTWTTDAGWGCMLRSGQMMVAEGLIRHYCGRDWRFDPHKPPAKAYVNILRLFEDDPCAPFSLHKIAQFGIHYGKNIGEWFGPNTVCQVLRFLFETGPIEEVGLHLTDDGVIYKDAVRKLCCSRHNGKQGAFGQDLRGQAASSWRAVILCVPLRLGVEGLNVEYLPKLASFLSFPQSIGFVGGKPRSSYYFVAARNASDVYYLDPHHVQDHTPMDKRCETSSFHCEQLKKMPMTDLDPSLAVGFYCADEAQFNDLCVRLVDAQQDSYPMIEVAQSRPDFRTPAETAEEEIEEEDWEDGTL